MRAQHLPARLMIVAGALFFWVAFSGRGQRPAYLALGVVFLLMGVAHIRRARRRGPPTV
jgi:hypothetical protein